MQAKVVNLVTPDRHTHAWREALIPDRDGFVVARACVECMAVDLRPATPRDLRTLPVISHETSTPHVGRLAA